MSPNNVSKIEQNARPAKGQGLLTRLSLALRAFFSWNPQARR